MSYGPLTAWLFGKLPRHGDFVARGLDPARRDQMDHWLSAEMAKARDRFGESFTARYDAAPPVRFVLKSGAHLWEGGVLCASMDSAGRRFPVVMGAVVEGPEIAAGLAQSCENAVYAAFTDKQTVDDVMDLVRGADFSVGAPSGPKGWWIPAEPDSVTLPFAEEFPVGLMEHLLELVE